MARASKENQTGSEAAPITGEPATEPGWSTQVEFLRGLAAIVRDEELSELVLEQSGVRLSLRSRRPSIVPLEPVPALSTVALPLGALGMDMNLSGEVALEEVQQAAVAEETPGTPIVSPMVGVFFRSKSPDDPPFVEVGDHVEVGQVIGLVEAMKTFNEILSEVEGEVVATAAHNGEEVQAGAPLVVVR